MTGGGAAKAPGMGTGQEAPPRPAGLEQSRTYLPELESLRGLAILLVFAYHCDGVLTAAGQQESAAFGRGFPLPLAFVYAGYTGVSLFFLLSAFLLSLPFLDAMRGARTVSIRRYFERRALRILPLYWLVLAFAALTSALASGAAAPLAAGLAYMLFLNSVLDLGAALWPYSIPLWSLAIEVQFYLLLPLLTLGAAGPAGRRAGALLVLLLAGLYVAFAAGWLSGGSLTAQLKLCSSILGRLPPFAVGIGAAFVYQRHGTRLRASLAARPLFAKGGSDVVVIASLLGLAALLRWTVHLGFWQAEVVPWWRWGEAMAWGLVMLALLLAPIRLRVVIVNPLFDLLGKLSYSIFLLHVPALVVGIFLLRTRFPNAASHWTLGSAAFLAVLSLAIVAAAALTYRFVELPFLARKARVRR